MGIKSSRAILSESYLFNHINKKRDLDISFLNNTIDLKMLKVTLEEINLRRLPVTREIQKALLDGKITISYTDNKSSGIVFSPLMNNGEISRVIVNISKFAKKKSTVDIETGDVGVKLEMDYNVLYNLLFGAISILNYNRCNSPVLQRYLRTIYTDIMTNILSRSFGNAIYGDVMRFVVSYFYHNGEIEAKDLATVIKFDESKVDLLLAKYPEFFSGKEVNLEELLELIGKEFTNMRDVHIEKFTASAITMLGDSAFWLIDNNAYFLGVVALKCRRDKDVFTGHLLKNIEVDKGPIATSILQSL